MRDHQQASPDSCCDYGRHRWCRVIYGSWTRQQGAYRLGSVPAVASALGSCDFGTLLEEIRRAHGWKQAELAGVLGYSQSWVSKVLRGSQVLTVDQAREISRRLGIPVHLLRFSDPGGEDPAKRRDFGTALALAFVPLPTAAQVDDGTVPALTAITGAQRQLESATSARELAR